MEIISTVKVTNKLGLHARASAKLVSLSESFASEVMLGRDLDNLIDAKSIIAVMLLAANYGSELKLKVSGDDASQATAAIIKLFADKFDEGV